MADGGQLPQMMHMHDTDADVTVLGTEIESADGATAPMMRNANLARMPLTIAMFESDESTQPLLHWVVIEPFADQPTSRPRRPYCAFAVLYRVNPTALAICLVVTVRSSALKWKVSMAICVWLSDRRRNAAAY